ncbi:hypothetical protein DSO57_1025212 [Entomophthora muscae]|uniref:Uncharacterized protein n=1 Tax=Entomophthora muscae TaxID=34485 RepID=A0ACC2S4E2_9FUNG|nr:hypothetical protein DSO57_1025212 [Entomophthora muscae]
MTNQSWKGPHWLAFSFDQPCSLSFLHKLGVVSASLQDLKSLGTKPCAADSTASCELKQALDHDLVVSAVKPDLVHSSANDRTLKDEKNSVTSSAFILSPAISLAASQGTNPRKYSVAS